MFNSNSAAPSLADIAAVTGNNNDNMWGGNGGWWAIIILFALFGGWGNGGFFGNGTRGDSVVTNGDLQRGFDTQSLLNKIDGVHTAVNDLAYDQLARLDNIGQNVNNTGYNIMNAIQNMNLAATQNMNAIGTRMDGINFAIQQGQSDIKYNQATDTCSIMNAINQAVQTIMQNDNANYRQLHDENVANEMSRMKDLLAQKDQQIAMLDLANSQSAQSQHVIDALRPTPQPSYIVSNPWTGCSCTNGSCGVN